MVLPGVDTLFAFRNTSAATRSVPATRIPASPASTAPAGAIRSTSPGATSSRPSKTPMPLPETEREVSSTKLVPLKMSCGGGVALAVLAPLPASMLPHDDQTRMSPPCKVNTRDWFTRKSPDPNDRTVPPRTVTIPSSAACLGRSPGFARPALTRPLGTRISMSPPCSVLIWLKNRLMSPWPAWVSRENRLPESPGSGGAITRVLTLPGNSSPIAS